MHVCDGFFVCSCYILIRLVLFNRFTVALLRHVERKNLELKDCKTQPLEITYLEKILIENPSDVIH
jgi:hypothetical protein